MNIAKQVLWFAIFLIFAVILMGMSGMGTAPNQTQSPFRATIMDIGGNKVDLSGVSIDGKTSFNGFMGKGRIQIPFDNISRIDISKDLASIKLKGSKKLCTVEINRISNLHGKTPFGTYQIPLRKIRWMDLFKAE
ncbi:MAG: hypothetical protein U9P80_09200 [Thermodesulfobacteriota bacterium]|nr:hypothetical protein [Thermodesulfobacteriota bacterium]